MRESVELVHRNDLPSAFYSNDEGLLSIAATHIWCNRIEHRDVLRAILSESGLTTEKASEMSGFSPRQFERWLSGAVRPRQETLDRVATALEVPLLPLVMSMSATEVWEEWGENVAPCPEDR